MGAARAAEPAGQMSHREVLEALSGLLLAMFVAMLSSTIVTTALPRIVADLDGTQTGYSWVMVATLLAMTATTPLWGKLADLVNPKPLVQIALLIYCAGSVVAALAPGMSVLITARVLQGLGVGGLTALVQVVIAGMVSPRERGRYSGYIGAVFAIATVSGPLLGGLIVDSPLGWRGCFFVVLPFAAVAFGMLQRTLHLPTVRRPVSIDYLGAGLIVGGVSALLVWVSLAGQQFGWVSTTSAGLLALAVVLLALTVYVEARVATEPVVPLRLFRDRTTVLATGASVMVGVAMFGAMVYLAQYFQMARGMTPTDSGLMSVALVGGLAVASVVSGRMITRTGRWKRWLVVGSALVAVGYALLATIDATTSLVLVGAYMVVAGLGIGATLQNLVLAVQNSLSRGDLGAGSSLISFFRTLGGSIGVSALGAVLAHRVAARVSDGLDSLGIDQLRRSGSIPDLGELPAPVRLLYEQALGDAVGLMFLMVLPLAVGAVVCTLFIEEKPLRTSVADEPLGDEPLPSVAAAGVGRSAPRLPRKPRPLRVGPPPDDAVEVSR